MSRHVDAINAAARILHGGGYAVEAARLREAEIAFRTLEEPPVDGGRALVAAILMQPMIAATWRPRRDRPQDDIAEDALEFADALLEAIRGRSA